MSPLLAPGRFERQIPPVWDKVTALWDDCQAFFAARGLAAEETHSLTMASSELLENAVKYGDWSHAPQAEVRLAIEVDHRTVTIEVRSPVADDAAALRRLDDRIQWLRGFQSSFEAYVERLKQVSALPMAEGESGLGLIRIAYEARCVLDFYLTPAQQLAMCAVYTPRGLY